MAALPPMPGGGGDMGSGMPMPGAGMAVPPSIPPGPPGHTVKGKRRGARHHKAGVKRAGKKGGRKR